MKKSSYWLAGTLSALAVASVVPWFVRNDRLGSTNSGPPPGLVGMPVPTPSPSLAPTFAARATPTPAPSAGGDSPGPVVAHDLTRPWLQHTRGLPPPTLPVMTYTPAAPPGPSPARTTDDNETDRAPHNAAAPEPTPHNQYRSPPPAPGASALPSPVHADLPLPTPTATPPTNAPQPANGLDTNDPKAAPSAASADPLAGVDAALQKMDWGQMAFDVPERLRKDQTALVHLIVSPTASGVGLTATLRAEATEPIKIESAQIQISDLMEARLVGSAFDIQPITPEEPQMVGHSQPTEWKWEIHPRQTGRQSLHLTLNAIVRYRNEKTLHPVRTFDQVIEVEVAAARSFHERAAPWLLPVLGLAALAGVAAFFFRRRRRMGALRMPAATEGMDLFVSYSRRDQDAALALSVRLQGAGYKVWIDQRGIEGATLWAQEISEAIRRSRACVLFASVASFGSANVARELSLVCEEGKPILPLLLEPAPIPSALRFQLAGIQQIELFRGEAEENFQKVLRALAHLGVTPRPVTTETR